MSDPTTFKAIFLALFFSLLAIRVYFQRKAGNYEQGVQEHAAEHLRNEVPLLRWIRPTLGIVFYAAMFAWLFSARWVEAFILPLPDSLRWSGAAVGATAILLAFFGHRALGANFRPTLGLHANHRLVTSGPYARIRHPIYAAFLLLMLSGFLLSANWLMGVSGISLLLLVFLLRIPEEEQQLRHKFGAEYASYACRTGAFVPRIRPHG